MISKLVEAMDAYFKSQPGYYVADWKEMPHHRTIDLDFDTRELMRVILEAMREPTREMMAHAVKRNNLAIGHYDIYQDMIDAALAEEPK
jgi:hypothetical protein